MIRKCPNCRPYVYYEKDRAGYTRNLCESEAIELAKENGRRNLKLDLNYRSDPK